MAELMEMCEQDPYHPADLPELLQAQEREALLETGRSDC